MKLKPKQLILIAIFFAGILGVLFISTQSSIKTKTEKSEKAVLVTGASSGIGLKITELLSSRGYFVYAGARKEEDLERLNAMDNVQALRLDVTKQNEIDAAVQAVSHAGRGLHGLVNNAGVITFGPLIEIDESELDFLFDVNIYGTFRITQAFAPLILESKGRITNIGSIYGVTTTKYFAPYVMSKHALEAYSDILHDELARFGVHVSIVEPGNYNSNLVSSMIERAKAKNMSFENSRYRSEFERFKNYDGDRSMYKEPDEVAEAVHHSLFDANPKRRYLVAPNQQEANEAMQLVIRRLVQLNENQTYTFSRDALVELLDAELERLS